MVNPYTQSSGTENSGSQNDEDREERRRRIDSYLNDTDGYKVAQLCYGYPKSDISLYLTKNFPPDVDFLEDFAFRELSRRLGLGLSEREQTMFYAYELREKRKLYIFSSESRGSSCHRERERRHDGTLSLSL